MAKMPQKGQKLPKDLPACGLPFKLADASGRAMEA